MDNFAEYLKQIEAKVVAKYFASLYALRGVEQPQLESNIKDKGDGVYDLRLSGTIGSYWGGVNTEAIIRDLDKLDPKQLNLIINSPGGYHTSALALYNDLMDRQEAGMLLTSRANGIVASAAVKLFLAAPKEERTIAQAEFMIHKPWSYCLAMGNSDTICKRPMAIAGRLTVADSTYYELYAKRLDKERSQIETWLEGEDQWFTAREAAKEGFGKLKEATPNKGKKTKSQENNNSTTTETQEEVEGKENNNNKGEETPETPSAPDGEASEPTESEQSALAILKALE